MQNQSSVDGMHCPEDDFVSRECGSEASTRDEVWDRETLHHPTPAYSEWEEQEGAHSPRAVYSSTPDCSETGTLENNLGMHDSTSSLKNNGGYNKGATQYSVNTMPVHE